MAIPMRLNKKIKTSITTIIILYSSLLLASGERLIIQSESENNFECEAIVANDSASFVFQEEEKYPNTILWERNNLPSSVAHTWWVFFQLENENQDDIDIRLSLIINQFDTKEVKFVDLLSDAQKVSSRYHDNGYFTINNLDSNDLYPSIEDSNLILTLRDKEIILLLLDNKPIAANFWILEEDKIVRKCLTNIQYR